MPTNDRLASGSWTRDRRSSERLVPRHRELERAGDESDHAVGLHEVAPLLARVRVNVLSEQPMAVPAGEHLLEERAGFVAPANRRERADVPERAHEKGRLRHAEVVRSGVAIDEVSVAQIAA